MLSLWVQEDETRERATDALPPDASVHASAEWEDFRASLPGASCAIVLARKPSDSEVFADLQLLRQENGAGGPGVPLVLCLPRSSAVLRRLKDVLVEEVVWLDELETELAPAVRRARAERWFRVCRDRIEAADRLSDSLCRALCRALIRHPPVTSVQQLAREVDRDRRTLWHHWDNAVDDGIDLTLKGFLDWIVLLRAGVERSGAESWEQVAAEFGVHTRTLRRTARRRTDGPLGRLDDRGLDACFRRFDEEVLPHVTGSPPEDQTPRA